MENEILEKFIKLDDADRERVLSFVQFLHNRDSFAGDCKTVICKCCNEQFTDEEIGEFIGMRKEFYSDKLGFICPNCFSTIKLIKPERLFLALMTQRERGV